MAKRKLERTVYLAPRAKVERLGQFRLLVKTRKDVYTTAHPEIIGVLNNAIIHSYKKCKQIGAGEDELKVMHFGLKERGL